VLHALQNQRAPEWGGEKLAGGIDGDPRPAYPRSFAGLELAIALLIMRCAARLMASYVERGAEYAAISAI